MTGTGSTKGTAPLMPPAARLAERGAFLVWGTPDLGPRSRVLARELGIREVAYIHTALPRRRVSVALRYPLQALKTVAWLARVRPRYLFVQHPPSVPAWMAAAWSLVSRGDYVLDCHSATFQVDHWRWPGWLHRRLLRRAAAVLVTDPLWAAEVAAAGGRPLVIPDVPVRHTQVEPFPGTDGVAIAVVNTWAADEPLAAILEAAGRVPEATFRITGRTHRLDEVRHLVPPNVEFTGFLSEARYLGLLASADAVMCLTTRDHTMQRGACEALSLGRPVITSDWPILRAHFDRAGVYVDATPAGIADGVRRQMADLEGFRQAAVEVRARRRHEWLARKRDLIERLVGPGPDVTGGEPDEAAQSASMDEEERDTNAWQE